MFKSGDNLIHTESNRKCIFKEYEVEDWTGAYDCAWVIFNRIAFKQNVEKLVYIKNLKES